MDYSIKINEFEGPLDLLLHLIKQSNINIVDIEINEITKQYLDYINKMEELNINVAASYLVMAAELMEIKSKSLLPNQEDDEEETEDAQRSAGREKDRTQKTASRSGKNALDIKQRITKMFDKYIYQI